MLNLMFGAFALIWPRVTFLTLVWIFAIVMMIQGFYQLASTLLNSREKNIPGYSFYWHLSILGQVLPPYCILMSLFFS
jgi:uncharacterized membrane protein HdeD (DUF308 family)